MKNVDFMEVVFNADAKNNCFARACVAAFCLPLNPSVDELSDIRTAVSEAVTNCIVHAYPNKKGEVKLRCEINGYSVKIQVSDNGVGIKDIAKAREPFFTTSSAQERSGMGFTVMEGFMDKVEVEKNSEKGTTVTLYKEICQNLSIAEGE